MNMIPGAWEPRRHPSASVNPLALPGPPVAAGPAAIESPAAPRHEMPGWLGTSIFAAALVAVSWLAMYVQALAR